MQVSPLSNNTSIEGPPGNILEIFNKSLIDYISIYGVASLANKTNLLPLNEDTTHKQVTSFIIDGELKGFIKCIHNQSHHFNDSLLKESFNILLGHILTQLEKNNLFCALSAPIEKDYELSLKEYNFTFKYILEDNNSSLPIQFNCYLDTKVLK